MNLAFLPALPHPLHYGVKVYLLDLRFNTQLPGFLYFYNSISRVNQHFGGYAAPVETGPTYERAFIYEGSLVTPGCGCICNEGTTAGTNHDSIIISHQRVPPYLPLKYKAILNRSYQLYYRLDAIRRGVEALCERVQP